MDLEQQFAQERVEARSVAFTDIDVQNDGWSFSGYASVFDVVADLGDYTEDVKRGSIRKALPQSGNIPMVYDHNMTLPILATTGAGTLGLKEDGKGMAVRADLPKHFLGEAVRELVQRGDIRGMSFGFIAGAGNSRIERRDGRPHRSLVGFKKILDVSPTWDPAYQGTSAELRSLRAAVGDAARDDLEQLLRAPDIEELRAALRDLEGLQSIMQRVEAALATVQTIESVVEDEKPDEPAEGESDSTPDPGADGTAPVDETDGEVDAAATGEVDEQRSGVDVDVDAAARRRRLHMLGMTLPK